MESSEEDEARRDADHCLILDIGGVLVDDIMGDDWLRDLARRSGLSYSEVADFYQLTLKDDFFRGRISRASFWQRMIDFLGVFDLSEQEVLGKLQPREALNRVGGWTREVKVGALSNHISAWLLSNPAVATALGNMDFVLISDYTGVRKPNGEAFALAISTAKVDPNSIMYVDNQLPNLQAAQVAGITNTVLANGDGDWTASVDKWIASLRAPGGAEGSSGH